MTTPTKNIFAPTPPPKGGGSSAPGNIFTPTVKKQVTVNVRHVGPVKPVAPKSIEQGAQEFAQAKAIQRGHGIVSPVAAQAAAAHQVHGVESVQPVPVHSTTRRWAPNFSGEPIAGWQTFTPNVGMPSPVGPARAQYLAHGGMLPYYSDAHTAKQHGDLGVAGKLGVAPDEAGQKALEQVYKETHPLGQAVIAGLASTLPTVATAKRLAEGKAPTLSTVGSEAINATGLLGGDELLAPVRAARAGVEGARGGSVIDAFQAARQAVKVAPKPVINAAARTQYAKTLTSAGYTKKEQSALLALHDQVALSYAHSAGVTPEQAWDRIYAHSQYNDQRITNNDVATGRVVFAQEGEKPEIQNVAATPDSHINLPETNLFFKRQSANLVRKHRGALPEGFDTPKKLNGLLQELRQRAVEAQHFKDWYQRSANAITQHVGGDSAEADKLAALIAVYSPRAEVYSKSTDWNNLDRAIHAYDEFKSTGEISPKWSISSHKTGEGDWQTFRAQQIMQGNFAWDGLKTNRFYRNFLQHINPTKYAEQFGTEKFGTMDTWMRRGFKYPKKYSDYAIDESLFGTTAKGVGKPQEPITPAMYRFMEQANRVIADSLGWSPEEAQAAIWTSVKSEAEGTPLSQAGFDFADAFAHRQSREATKPTPWEQLLTEERPQVQKYTASEASKLTPDPNYLYHETSNPEGIDAARAIHAQETEGKGPGVHAWLRETPYPAYGGSHVYAIPRDLVPHDLLGKRLALGNYATTGDVHFGGNMARETARVQIANEAKPGDASIFEGQRALWDSLTTGEQASYANEIFKVTRQGQFEKIVGLDSKGHHMGFGVWRGGSSVGTANHVIVEQLSPKEIADLNAVAAAKGIVQSQDWVSWGRPLARDVTGDGIFPGFLWRPKNVTPESIADIGSRVDAEFGAGWVGIIHGPEGSYYFVDFSGAKGFDSRLHALLGDGERVEPISWEGGYVEDARSAQEGAWGVTYQDAIASHPKARELQAAIGVAQEKVGKIADDFRSFAHERADARFEDALAEAAAMLGKRIPKNGRVGNRQDRADALTWIAHEARNSTDPDVQRVADTLDQATEARNSPDPEHFFQTDNPLLSSIASAQDKMLSKMKIGPRTNADLKRMEGAVGGERRAVARGGPQNNADLQRMAGERVIKGLAARTTHGEHILHFFKGADVSTAVHELGHAVETMLPAESRQAFADAGINSEEQFARSWERYFFEGDPPTAALKKPMRTIAARMADIYKSGENIPEALSSPEIKGFFDAFFTREAAGDPSFAPTSMAWFAQQGPPEGEIPEHAFEEGDAAAKPSEGKPRPGEQVGGTPQQQLRHGLKGARLRYGVQKAARSEERQLRAKKVAEAMRTIDDPDEAAAAALASMRGELPRIDFGGLKVLDAHALRELKSVVQHHEALLPFQKVRLIKTLDQAVNEGRVPTPSEIKLIEHVFGKVTATGIVSSTHTWGDTVINILNIPRTLMATADLSAAVRQGLVAGASHPAIWGKAWPAMLRSFKSPKVYEQTMKNIESDTLYPLALAAHVSFTDVSSDAKLISHEEQFASDYAAQIPGIGHVVKGSARAYTAFLNKIRMDLFKHQIRIALQSGRNVNDEEFLKGIGDVVNAATGRGTIHGRAEHILPALNTLMFSPRLMLSRLNYLDPTWYVRLHPAARKEALRGLFATAGAVTTAVYLASRIPGVHVASTDPRSSDFGKVKFGNTRLDLAGGFQQYIKLASVLATGEKISSATGFKTKLGSKYGAPTRFDEIVNFAAGKAAPPVSASVELLKGKDIAGNKVTPKDIAVNFFTPLVLQDARDIYNDRKGGANGIAWALGGYGLGAVGIGEQTYGPPTTRQDNLTKLAKKAGVAPPSPELLKAAEHDQYLSGVISHTKDWNGRLRQAASYYAQQTGDHSFDEVAAKALPDFVAHQIYESIRLVLVGPGLAAYEHALKTATGGG